MSWKNILKIDAEQDTPNPEMVKIVRFISDFGKKHDLEGFEKLEEEAQYGHTTKGDKEWEDMDMMDTTPPSIWFEYSALNKIINTSASSESVFEMKVKIRDAVRDKFGGWLAADEGMGLVTYR